MLFCTNSSHFLYAKCIQKGVAFFLPATIILVVMSYIQTAILGLVQGLTEFLPVSSSGHLHLTQVWLGLSPSVSLEVLLHGASLVAVVLYFWSDIIQLIHEFFVSDKPFFQRNSVLLLFATMCTMPVALGVQHLFADDLTLRLVGITLLVTAFLIYISNKGRGNRFTFTPTDALVVGVMQGVAALPGISRSGLTIAVLLLLGIQRKEAARLSFLLSVPTILAALVFSISDAGSDLLTLQNALGFMVALVASFAGIRWLMGWVSTRWLWFGGYCGVVGVALLIFA